MAEEDFGSWNYPTPTDYYRLGDQGTLEGGGYTDFGGAPPAGRGYANPSSGGTSYQPRLGGGGTGLNPWESNAWTPDFGSSNTGGSGFNPGARPQPNLGPRELGPGYPRIPLPSSGAPERTLYDRYSQMLKDPSQMTQDPAYKFLFDQGMQAFNRTAAANRMRFSGKSMNDSMKYGEGMASNYFNQMIPQYGAGAQQELMRWQAPAQMEQQRYGLAQRDVGLGQSGTQLNNATRGDLESERAAGDLVPMMSDAYRSMIQGPGPSQPTWGSNTSASSGPGYSAPSFGGVGGGYQARLGQGDDTMNKWLA